jgi:hypothetical protein
VPWHSKQYFSKVSGAGWTAVVDAAGTARAIEGAWRRPDVGLCADSTTAKANGAVARHNPRRLIALQA